MDQKKQIQESEYFYPYHYALKRGNVESLFFFSYIDALGEFLKNIRERIVLDAGCGDAFLFYNLKNNLLKQKNTLIGIDYSERAITFAKLLNSEPNIDFRVANLEETDNTQKLPPADIIISSHVFEHIPLEKEAEYFSSIKRLLAPNGDFLMVVPSENLPMPQKHFRHFNQKELREIFERNGFEVLSSKEILSSIYFRFLGLFFNRLWKISFLESFFFNICLRYFKTASHGLMIFIVAKKRA